MNFISYFVHTERFRLNYYIIFVLIVFSALLLTSCKKEAAQLPVVEQYDRSVDVKHRYNLKLGVVAGPYAEMFQETMLPHLKKRGYTIEMVEYGSYAEPNFALAEYEIDMNMCQNYSFLNNFKFENNVNLSAVSEIPTASMGLYSKKYKSADEIEDGAIVAMPNDTSNMARAIGFLDYVNLISVDPFVNKAELTMNDITVNEKNLLFIFGDPDNLVASLDKYEMAVINGNFAMSGGLNLSDALYNELLTENYINIIAVRTEDLGELFVQDIIDIVYSEEYMKMFADLDGKYQKFQLPRYFLASRGGAQNK